jgi:hypothetical protein
MSHGRRAPRSTGGPSCVARGEASAVPDLRPPIGGVAFTSRCIRQNREQGEDLRRSCSTIVIGPANSLGTTNSMRGATRGVSRMCACPLSDQCSPERSPAHKQRRRGTTILGTNVGGPIDGDERMRHLYASWSVGDAICEPEDVQHCADRPASPDSPRRRRSGLIAPSLPSPGITNRELSRPTITCGSPSIDSPTAPAGRAYQAPSFLSAGRVPQAPRPPFVAT